MGKSYFYSLLVKRSCCSCSVAQSYPTLCNPMDAAHQVSMSFTISQSLFKLMSIDLVMPSSHLILCSPLLLLVSIFPSIRVFSNELALCIRWPKYWSFSFSISPSNEYSGLIFFRTDCSDLLDIQGTLKSLLQHHSLKASILQCSAFFMVQLTSVHDYWKNHSFDYMNFVVKVMSLLFSEEKSLIIFIKCLQLNF